MSTPTTSQINQFRSKDMELYNLWKTSGDPKHFGALVQQISPLVYQEVARTSGTLPTAALSAEAKSWAVKAIMSYDPSKGTQLSTHIMSYLPKVRRLNYKYQNMVRLPENLHLQFHEFSSSIQNLTDRLNREPTNAEIAKELGWSEGQVTKYKEGLYADIHEGAAPRPSEHHHYDKNQFFYQELFKGLTDDERFILENSDKMSNPELASHLGVNVNRFNYLKSKLKDRILEEKRRLGID